MSHEYRYITFFTECPSPDELAPANGNIEYTVTTVGATGTITCNEGYTLEGTGTTITCLDTNQWSTHTITCKIKGDFIIIEPRC